MKYLFLVKGGSTPHSLSNSANFSLKFLEKNGVEAHIATIPDYTHIEDVVSKYKPTHIIIESIFVVPIEFMRLFNLFRGVKWFIRVHSDIGFFFAEIYGMEWMKAYQTLYSEKTSIKIVANNDVFARNISSTTKQPVLYLPNLYPITTKNNYTEDSNTLEIGCFGALRLLKNQGFQALAAIHFADRLGKKLNFHINVGSSELRKNTVLINMRSLFRDTKHSLIEHGWTPHDKFMELIRSMHIGMQLSYTESFNLVTCDFIANGVPIAISETINWGPVKYKTSTINIDEVVNTLEFLYSKRNDIDMQNDAITYLQNYENGAEAAWFDFIKSNI